MVEDLEKRTLKDYALFGLGHVLAPVFALGIGTFRYFEELEDSRIEPVSWWGYVWGMYSSSLPTLVKERYINQD